MNVGDLLWGMIIAYLLLGGIWLAVEQTRRVKRRRQLQRKWNDKRRATIVEMKRNGTR